MDQLQLLIARNEIVDLVLRFARAFDTQDWAMLRSCLMDVINTDYSQFRGEPPTRIAADDYVAARQTGLAGLRTLHISTNHIVTVTGDEAECYSAYQIFRLDPQRPASENRLDTAGTYQHGLVRISGNWRITSIKQTMLMQVGNPQVHGALRR